MAETGLSHRSKWVNEEFKRLFHYEPGQYAWDIAPEHWRKFIKLKRERVRVNKQPELSIEMAFKKDGNLYHATWVDAPIFARNSTRVIGWRGYGATM